MARALGLRFDQISDLINMGKVLLVHETSGRNISDFLTKPQLELGSFYYFEMIAARDDLGVFAKLDTIFLPTTDPQSKRFVSV